MRAFFRKVVALVALCMPLAAHATTIRPMSLAQLTRGSSTIVLAQAVSVRSQWNADHRLIYTYTEFAVQQALKGSPAANIVVRQLGGRIGDVEMRVEGVRHWHAGEQTVLFLNPDRSGDGTYLVTGLLQGDFRVSRDPGGEKMVTNPVGAGVVSYNPASHQILKYAPAHMSLARLQTLVRQYQSQEER